MRLIDADATIKEIKARNPDDVSYEDAWAITCIEHAPTIEPERKTGKWIQTGKVALFGAYVRCSVCGESFTATELAKEIYCRHCGAYMGGVTE